MFNTISSNNFLLMEYRLSGGRYEPIGLTNSSKSQGCQAKWAGQRNLGTGKARRGACSPSRSETQKPVEGFSTGLGTIETVERVSYNVLDKRVEIHLETKDEQDFYEDVMGNPFNGSCPRV